MADASGVDALTIQRAHMVPVIDTYLGSSVAAWGTATADGNLYQTRNVEWILQPNAHEFPVIVVYIPDEGVPHANVGFAGFVGCHTGMNLAGVALSEMSDSPFGEDPYDIDGVHFTSMFRTMLYDSYRISDALDILEPAQRIRNCHYVIGDGLWEHTAVKAKAHASETPPDDLIIVGDNDPADELYPNVMEDIVYNDDGRGAWALIQAGHGTLDADAMINIANSIPIVGSNVMNVVFGPSNLEMWVAYASGYFPTVEEAYLQPYVYVNLMDYLP